MRIEQVVKSEERKKLEFLIDDTYDRSLKIANELVQEKYNGDLRAAQRDISFVAEMQMTVYAEWQRYLALHDELFDLEQTEGNLSYLMDALTFQQVFELLPSRNQEQLYYAFAGLDFTAAAFFKKMVVQDLGYDQKDLPNLWWGLERYSSSFRQRLIQNLKQSEIIPPPHQLTFIGGDADSDVSYRKFNSPESTLMISGGHSFVSYAKWEQLHYGAIILGSPADKPKDIAHLLRKYGYDRVNSRPIMWSGWQVPYKLYANYWVFVKKEKI